MTRSKWKRTAALLVAALSVAASSPLAYAGAADEGKAPAGYVLAQASGAYQLTDQLEVEVTGILNERTSTGTRIVALVSMKNTGAKVTRVPDYELRIRTENGGEYVLTESSANIRSIQPNAKVDLSYMTAIDGAADHISLTELVWVQMDWYVYPKEETIALTVPVSGLTWSGDNAAIGESTPVLAFGQPFQLPTANETLTFEPVNVSKSASEQKLAYIVKVLVDNPGSYVETIPDFLLEGRDGKNAYKGSRVEQGTLTLEAGEKRYVHFAIPTDQDSMLKNVIVMTTTTEQAATGGSVYTFAVGRINIQLPDASQTAEAAVSYKLKQDIPFDPLNKLVGTDMNVSLVELSMLDNDAKGYKTVMAKFKLRNLGHDPVPVPAFQAELSSGSGYTYSGSRQTNAPKQLMPGLSHVIDYSFIVPATETGEHVTLKLLDETTVSPYKSTISALNVSVHNEDQPGVWSFYPFEVKLSDWSVASNTTYTGSAMSPIKYTYKLKLDLIVNQLDDVVADDNFSKMNVTIEDSQGREIGEESLSFTANNDGNRKLVSGQTTIQFDNLQTDEHEYPLTFKIYESIETPNGTAKRLVGSFRQTH